MNQNKNRKKLIWPIIIFSIGITACFSYFFGNNLKYFTLPPLFDLGFILILLSILWVCYQIVITILNKYEKQYKDKNELIQIFFVIASKITKITFLILVCNITLLGLPLPELHRQLINKGLNVILIVYIGWILLQVLDLLETWLRGSYSTQQYIEHIELRGQYTKIRVIKQVIAFIIIAITLASALMLFGNVRTVGVTLLASTGFLAAILGFAAQKPISTLFINFNLAFSQPIRIGDVVNIHDEFGTVEEIKMNYAVIKIWDSRRMIVPINFFFENAFQNWSYKRSDLLGSIFLYVDYNLPLEKLRKALMGFVEETPLWNKAFSNLQVTDFKETCMELRILVSANSPEELWNLRALIREKMIYFIKINFPDFWPNRRLFIINKT